MRTWDYIVVGGGTAGSVLAARLSEDASARVLLLEAGPANGPTDQPLPRAWPDLVHSAASWDTTTAPQADAGPVPYPGGRMLGGSGAIGSMVHLRGHRDGFAGWPEGWDYDALLPYFMRSEQADGRDPAHRGSGGPVRVARSADPHPVSQAFFDAAVEVGHPISGDLNGAVQDGVAWLDLNVVNGLRQSAADAYLSPVRDRPNLEIRTGAHVTGLVVENGRCTGVEYGGSVVCADGEVILCAGAVGSPLLLLRSGIGPAAELRAAGLDVVADLPGVGRNLQDHPVLAVRYACSGPLPPSLGTHVEAAVVLRTGLTPHVDVQLMCDMSAGDGYAIAATVVAPRSRGTVRLAADGSLIVDPNLLDDEHDTATLLVAVELARQVGQASALAGRRKAETVPGDAIHAAAARRVYARRAVRASSHATGTCRIGADGTAVVDPALRVHGVEALRIADASVLPGAPAAGPSATVLAVAERAASLVRER
jgi:choline dehydrogenase